MNQAPTQENISAEKTELSSFYIFKSAGLMNQAPTKRHERNYSSFASLTPFYCFLCRDEGLNP